MKKKTTLMQIWIAVAVLGLAVLACGPDVPETQVPNTQAPGPTPSGGLSRSDLIAATVQIFGSNIENGDIIPIYVGSGSIISRDGLILTNAHVASPASQGNFEIEPDVLVIGIVQSEDQPPVYAYRAEVAAVDGYMDLAVIRITATLKGDSIDPSSLNLPFVPMGDSDQVHVGDHINILGFPLIGGNTITYTDGNVSGFSPEDQLGDRAWIKTDATISGGNSGGMAANDDGRLIGVPSIASSGANTDIADCRVVQDTNGDGRVDENDTCIPIGGFINGLRPVNLARPLIQAAKSGQAYSSPYGTGQGSTAGTGNERFGPVTWLEVPSVGPCEFGDETGSYPSGALGVAAFFQFSGMTDGQLWAEVWTIDGEKVFDSAYNWESGASGTYTDCLSNGGDPMPDGSYHVEFYGGGDGNDLPLLTSGDVVVGGGQGPTPPGPQGGDVRVSGTVYDQDTENPIAGAFVVILKSGVKYQDWYEANYPDSDVYTYAQTDSQGRYTLPDMLQRNTPYTLVVLAEGYLSTYGDDLVWSDSEPANYTLDVPLTK